MLYSTATCSTHPFTIHEALSTRQNIKARRASITSRFADLW